MQVYDVRTTNNRTYRFPAYADEIIVDSSGNIYYVGTANRYCLTDNYTSTNTNRPYWVSGTRTIYDGNYTTTTDRYGIVSTAEVNDDSHVDYEGVIYPVLMVTIAFCALGLLIFRRRA